MSQQVTISYKFTMYIKKFDDWNIIKKGIDSDAQKSNVRPGEIRWMFCGVNVGSEIDGKGDMFSRPALILDTIGTSLALVVPMSSKIKDRTGYVPIDFHLKRVSLCIHQMKVVSQKRFFRRICKLSKQKLSHIKKMIREFYHMND